MFKVDSSALVKWLQQASASLQKGATDALHRTARYAATEAKSSSRYESHTYKLRKSIRAQLLSPQHARTIADARHAGWVENGNKPLRGGNKIYPTQAKALRFVLNGQVHFRKWVHAAAPRPFMRDARVASIPYLDRLAHAAATDAFK